ncbi:MAG: site-specific integrase [Methanomassiliicoccus sp.]|nr:site-specific integrase [Methanomassiliicoccus sp.]
MPRRSKWAEDMDAWEAALFGEGKSPNTVETYLEAADYALRFAKEHDWPLNPRQLTPAHVYQYYENLQGYRSKTQATYMFGFMHLMKFVKNPGVKSLKLHLKPERGEVYWLEREQIMKLLECWPTERLLAARVLWIYTGIREVETRHLRKRNLTERWLSVESGKGRKARKIPIDDEFWAMMQPYLTWREQYERRWGKTDYFLAHPEDHLHVRGPLKPFSEGTLSEMSKEHGRSIGIEHANSHPFRRQFGRDLYYNQCPPTQIQAYYGHTTLEQTMRYIGVEEEIAWEAMKKYRSSYRRKT